MSKLVRIAFEDNRHFLWLFPVALLNTARVNGARSPPLSPQIIEKVMRPSTGSGRVETVAFPPPPKPRLGRDHAQRCQGTPSGLHNVDIRHYAWFGDIESV